MKKFKPQFCFNLLLIDNIWEIWKVIQQKMYSIGRQRIFNKSNFLFQNLWKEWNCLAGPWRSLWEIIFCENIKYLLRIFYDFSNVSCVDTILESYTFLLILLHGANVWHRFWQYFRSKVNNRISTRDTLSKDEDIKAESGFQI